MKDVIIKINKVSLYLSVFIVSIMVIGYILGITIICGSLLTLLNTMVMTIVKFIMYFAMNTIETIKKFNMMTMATLEIA